MLNVYVRPVAQSWCLLVPVAGRLEGCDRVCASAFLWRVVASGASGICCYTVTWELAGSGCAG